MGASDPPEFRPLAQAPPRPAATSQEVPGDAEDALASKATARQDLLDGPSVFSRLTIPRIVDDTVRQSARRVGLFGAALLVFVIAGALLSALAVILVGRMETPPLEELPGNPSVSVSLPDGQYVMATQRLFISQDTCFFEGTAERLAEDGPPDGAVADSVVVISGRTLAECGMEVENMQGEFPVTAPALTFVVRSGSASILRLESSIPSTRQVFGEP